MTTDQFVSWLVSSEWDDRRKDVYQRQDMRREKTREELNQLFYPDLSRMTAGEKGELYGTEYLVCKLSLIHI